MAEESFKLFFSYSHKDENLRDELAKYLIILERQGVISSWYDRKILAGGVWDEEIKNNLKTADIILLLISVDFLHSQYCWDVELKMAIERHEKGEACVIPVILRNVDWVGAPFARLQALPKNAEPVVSRYWHTQDDAFTDVAKGIRAAVEALKQKREERQREQEAEILRQQEAEALRRHRELEEAEKRQRKQEAEIRRQQEAERLKREQAEVKKLHQTELASDKGVDYTKLRDLLAAKKWKEADYETYLVMLQVIGREKVGGISNEELLNFPCTDLRTIDQLWVKYSNGHFGFSIQKEIYLSVGGKPDGQYYEEAWEKFGDRVGWRVKGNWICYSEVIFDTSSPNGHLPGCCYTFGGGSGCTIGACVNRGYFLFSRIEICTA
ncbi:GUN4 domain-containing protein [Anabaena sp. UHCC 0399]|uniref:GUN4 domain-containing protein n=1 Tax=Anabaena sp. UHCC 0399 TaxID=3110238 RepID=UPI002B2029B3|nr:GUN4 domain-containing protein [Anabaena sp. UHCC 0399]MEA5567532.1 GUN4 domain-containing protein [Anabaena sp. UHCC 0399]